jgi:hypothetical protein
MKVKIMSGRWGRLQEDGKLCHAPLSFPLSTWMLQSRNFRGSSDVGNVSGNGEPTYYRPLL